MKLIATLLVAAVTVKALGHIDPLELAKAVIPGTEEPAAVIDEMPLPDDDFEAEDDPGTSITEADLGRRADQSNADAGWVKTPAKAEPSRKAS
jgi:hypothetical protein